MNEQQTPQQMKDPAQVWWGDANPPAAARAAEPRQPEPPPPPEPWKWRYSALTGIMYGPIPVGLIIGLPLLYLLIAK